MTGADQQARPLLQAARLVLHRYVRHFGGQPRRNRDQQRLAAIIADLMAIGARLRSLRAQLMLTDVRQDVDAVGELLGFLLSERDEVAAAWQAGSLADRSQAAGDLMDALRATWQAQVAPEPRALRRPQTLQRLVDSLTNTLDTLHGLQHANLPDAHGERVLVASALLTEWQAELAASAHERAQLTTPALWLALVKQATTLVAQWQAQPDVTVATLCGWCDRLDDLEQQLREWMPADADGALIDEVRDALVALERRHDDLGQGQLPQAQTPAT